MKPNDVETHYLTDQIDPMFIVGSREFLWPHLRRGRILNVGLGYGTWDDRLAAETGSTVTGLDISATLVEEFGRRYPKIRYICSDVFAYQPESPFETIVASHFLEHVAEPVKLLRLFKSWLTPDGRLLLVVPNANSVHRRIGRQMGLLREVTDLNDGDRKLGHHRVYTSGLLREHLEQSGLRIDLLAEVTFKALSNAQLAGLPRDYVDACCKMVDLGDLACQLAAVATNAPRV